MSDSKKIGILTGGGDVPGLNPVIKSVVYGTTAKGREVIGIRKGWEGLAYMNGPDDPTYIWPLTRENTRTIERTGGTVLHTSRTNPRKVAETKLPKTLTADQIKKLPFDGKVYNLTSVVIDNLEKLGIGTLVAIGGDDTLSFASALSAAGFPTIAIPKTMDNDVQGTEYCIGFSTALTRAQARHHPPAHHYWLARAHRHLPHFRARRRLHRALYRLHHLDPLPDSRISLRRGTHLHLLTEDKKKNPSGYALVVASEGAIWKQGEMKEYGEADAYGHRKKVDIGDALGEEVRKRTGQEHGQRPDLRSPQRRAGHDRSDFGLTFGNIAVELIRDGISGRMIGIQSGHYTHMPLPDSSQGARRVMWRLFTIRRATGRITRRNSERR